MKWGFRSNASPLAAPPLPAGLPLSARWLAGEGAGSWFVITSSGYQQWWIRRYSPEGSLECEGIFDSDGDFDEAVAFKIGFPSHCAEVTLIQQGQRIVLQRQGDC